MSASHEVINYLGRSVADKVPPAEKVPGMFELTSRDAAIWTLAKDYLKIRDNDAHCLYAYGIALPIFLPALVVAFWPGHGFPWPFSLGLVTLVISVHGISKRFARTYRESMRLRLRNESLYQELAAERDASITANLAKSRFIASASHDLRQPMHAVNFYLESLDLSELPARVGQVVGRIRRSVTNLNQMFESLLDVSKLDSFTFHKEDAPFRLRALAGALGAAGSQAIFGLGYLEAVSEEASTPHFAAAA